MNGARTISAILNESWAIDPAYAVNSMPIIVGLLEGNFEGWDAADKDVVTYSIGETNVVQNYYRVERTVEKLREAPKGSILEINIEHAITRHDNCGDMGTLSIASLINAVNDMDNISGVLFSINSPGGQVSGMASATKAIKECTKPTATFIEDGIAASGGYWIASQTNKIYASSKSSSVGSIGAYITLVDMKSRLESMGIVVSEIYSRYSKDKNGSVRSAFSGDEEPMKNHLDFLVEEFVEQVRSARGISEKAGEGPFTGKMYFAEEAMELGLIDGIKTKEEVVQELISMSNNEETRYFV